MNKPAITLQSINESGLPTYRINRAEPDVDEIEYELVLAEKVQNGDQLALREIFSIYYTRLCIFANGYVKSIDASRDVVQDVFVNIWEKHDQFIVNQSLKGYLYRAVRNQSLNHLKKKDQLQRLEEDYNDHIEHVPVQRNFKSDHPNLTDKIWRAAEKLPEKRKAVFLLHRKHGLSYKEIAAVMGITTKTVENQMGRALKFIRDEIGV